METLEGFDSWICLRFLLTSFWKDFNWQCQLCKPVVHYAHLQSLITHTSKLWKRKQNGCFCSRFICYRVLTMIVKFSLRPHITLVWIETILLCNLANIYCGFRGFSCRRKKLLEQKKTKTRLTRIVVTIKIYDWKIKEKAKQQALKEYLNINERLHHHREWFLVR